MESNLCRKLLLRDLPQDELYNIVIDYINSIPEERKVCKDEYEKRIYICSSCENLVSGICLLCGCFVEVRAAKANQHCAKSKDIWA